MQGTESYVAEMLEKGDLSFFPVYKSMSLDQGNLEDPIHTVSRKISKIEEQVAQVCNFHFDL